MTCFDTFLTCFDTFLTVFDIFDIFLTDRPTDRQTDRQTDIQNLDVEAPARSLIKYAKTGISGSYGPQILTLGVGLV